MKRILAALCLLYPIACHATDGRMVYAAKNGGQITPVLAVPICSVDANGVPQVCGAADGSGSTAMTSSFSGGANLSVSTAASYTPFPSQTCKQLTIANNTGVTVQVQQGGSGAAQPVFPGTYYVFYGLTNASALSVERADGTATAVTVNARCEY